MATRRSNGEGTTPRKRTDGRWVIQIRTNQTSDGTETRKNIYGKTRAEAVAKAKAYRRELENGILADTSQQTLKNWAEHWLNTIQTHRVRPQTLATYRGYLERWTYTTPTAHKQLDKIKPKDIENIYHRMRDYQLKESTVHHMHRILSICFKSAADNDLIARNPMDRVPVPKTETFNPKVITPTQAQQLITALKEDEQWGANFTLNLALGPRQGERLALCWQDFNLEEARVKIERTIVMKTWQHGCAPEGEPARCGRKQGSYCPQRHGGGFIMGPPKNKAGKRTVPLPEPLVEMMRGHKISQRRKQLEAGKNWVGAVDAYGKKWDLVFTDDWGRLIRPNYDWEAWSAFTRAHGIEGMRVHDARHTAATVLLSMGVSPQVTMDIMGWSSVSMLGRYQHVLDEMRQDAADKVANVLFG